MTERIYYNQSKVDRFSARVLDIRVGERGRAVILDRTAFYPTGGGQPHDTGLIAGQPVFDVVEEESSGDVLHLMGDSVTLGVGDQVECSISVARRMDHMQQHTGQHILSQAFLRVCRAATVGFHMGEVSSTIDLDWSKPEEVILERAEDLANRIIFENRTVEVREMDREQADTLGLRKEATWQGRVRVIEIDAFDRTACGGTHAERTGEVGLVLIRGWEKVKGHCRIDFVCGGRALRDYRDVNRTAKASARLLTVGRDDLPKKIDQLLEEGKENRRRIRELAAAAAEVEAAEIASRAELAGSVRITRTDFKARELDELKLLAHRLAEHGVVALLGSVHAERASLVFAGPKQPVVALDLHQCIREVFQAFGGRGGGVKDFAQGVLDSPASLAGALDHAYAWCTRGLRTPTSR